MKYECAAVHEDTPYRHKQVLSIHPSEVLCANAQPKLIPEYDKIKQQDGPLAPGRSPEND